MTEKLYYTDAYMKNFRARVLSCEEKDGVWHTVLDRSAFYPGGGGQPSDTGSVGAARLISAYAENGVIVHVTDRAVSGEVDCAVDFDARFRRMQNHTGEHILSGLFARLYGAVNVGFHMGSEDVTLDLNVELTAEDIARVEALANEAVYENVPVTAYFPSREELDATDYRSKLEFPDGAQVRLVRIGDYDVCACSATHVRSTGEIGVIKITSFARYKGGVRIHMLAGRDAFEEYVRSYSCLTASAQSLSVRTDELGDALKRIEEKSAASARDKLALSRALADSLIIIAQSGAQSEKAAVYGGTAVFFEPLFGTEEMRYLINRAVLSFSGAAVFSGNDTDGYLFVLSAGKDDSRELLSRLRELIPINGGGKSDMVSGKTSASAEQIAGAFSRLGEN